MDVNKLIEEAEALSRCATPAPWIYTRGVCLKHYVVSENKDLALSFQSMHWEDGREVAAEADAIFIARARTLVPDLAVALKASEERTRKAEQDRDALAAANVAANNEIVRLQGKLDDASRLAHDNVVNALDIAKERDAARAELARLTTPRPIAEAPRDGTNILGVWLTSSAPEVMHWDGSYWTDEGEELVYKPTHYLPLPEVKP